MKYAAIVISLLLAACVSPTKAQSRSRGYLTEISYIKDTRPEPDICFAAMYLGANYGVLATVPCEAVEPLISDPSRGTK
jgi:hypothetical protein